MTLTQINTINAFYKRKYDEQMEAGEKMRQRILSLAKNPRTDSPRKLLPKLKNMSRCKARKGKEKS